MSRLIQELQKALPNSMEVPEPLILLYRWIEENNFYIDTEEARIGFLYPERKMKESWTDEGRDGGTNIEFASTANYDFKYWFGKENDEAKTRLCVIAQSGGEGSECALWLDSNDDIKVVHMGSGSGSTLMCILGDPIDFIRLLAIGYDEICWDENYPFPPSECLDFIVKPNVKFLNWVKETFNVSIPDTALEIVKYPSTMSDEISEDEFFNWCKKYRD